MIAAEDGYFYYLENPRSWAKRLPKSHLPQGEKLLTARRGSESRTRGVSCRISGISRFRWGQGRSRRSGSVQSLFSAYCPTPRIGERGMPELVLSFDPNISENSMFRVDPGCGRLLRDGRRRRQLARRESETRWRQGDNGSGRQIEANVTCAEPFWSFNGWAAGAAAGKAGEKCKKTSSSSARCVT